MKLRPIILLTLIVTWIVASEAFAAKPAFEKDIQPLLVKYCYGCHGEKKKGDLDLRPYATELAAKQDAQQFAKILGRLENREMPPENKPQPSRSERALLSGWIESVVLGCDCNHPDPGRVTIRRLNRAEYNNTIRDLTGIDFHPADDFPFDDIGYGFDNIGDLLSMSPLLMEKYAAAAEKILERAIPERLLTNGPVAKFAAVNLRSTAEGGPFGDGGKVLATEGELRKKFQFSKPGKYILRVRAFGQQAGPDPARMEFRLDGKPLKVFDVRATGNRPENYEFALQMEQGERQIGVGFINDYFKADDPDPDNRDRNLVVEYLEIIGPVETKPPPPPNPLIFIRQPVPVLVTTNDAARAIVRNFATRAFRRPVKNDELERLLKIYEMVRHDGGNFDDAIRLALEAVLVSPNFLFRGELQPEPDNAKSVHPVDEYALASRLSYFLWSSMPDDELFALAAKGQLRKSLPAQLKRMFKDPKSHALVENFADQWLQLRNLAAAVPDKETFPNFNDALRADMGRETEMFFQYVLQQDRSIFDFIDADYTFADERLAKFYGLSGVTNADFQRVSLKGTPRGGLLTQASILTLTSHAARTSPVKRGKWVLENILGTPPPPPPPDVPALKEDKETVAGATMRQRMEQHRANAICASCHTRMDPIGLGFENFNAIGQWRDKDGDAPIDSAGQLTSGELFKNPGELKQILLRQKREQFVHCLTEKMLTYALGRGLEPYDKCAVDEITKQLARHNYKFASLIQAVVESQPFEMRRGEEKKLAQAASPAN